MTSPERTFEQALTELEQHVRRLESGDLPLEEALALFEAGVTLARECHERLDKADQRLIELTRGPRGEIREREG